MSNSLDYIIPPVDRSLLQEELNKNTFVRKTNKGGNEIYVINHHNAPNTMREIGRLRELSFASAGGGTGKELDIDEHDTSDKCYQQLIIFSPEDKEIVGGYRFIDCSIFSDFSEIVMSTQHYFNFTKKFEKNQLSKSIELGRSWIQPMFQPSKDSRKGIFALDNLWDGLGTLAVDYKHIEYFFGKVTMYASYNEKARDAVLSFMHYYFPDPDHLIIPINAVEYYFNPEFLSEISGLEFKAGLKKLSNYVKKYGEVIPPLINQYMQLSPTMKTFGTAINKDFGEVEETGILIRIDDIYSQKKDRHIETYLEEKKATN